MTATDHSAQLTPHQRLELDNLLASFRMEGMEFTPAEVDVLAQQILGLITRDQANAALDALGH